MAYKLDAGQQWLRDETSNELVGIKDSVDGEERFLVFSETNPVTGGISFNDEWVFSSSEAAPDSVFPFLSAKSNGSYDLVSVPSPYSPGHVLHPSVIFFADGKRGYRYWMAYTPYPDSDSAYENPCIAVSNDGQLWVAPEGLTNPIFQKPAGASAYNSDTDLYFDGKQFVMLWRTIGEGGASVVKLFISTSSDGVTWADRAQIWTGIVNTSDMASPSIWYNAASSKWEIYGHNVGTGGTGALAKITSSSLLSGWDSAITTVTAVAPAGRYWWHSQLRRLADGSVIGIAQDNNGTVGSSGNLYALFSADGTVFSFAPIDLNGGWYRPSFVMRNDTITGEYYVEFYGSKLTTAGILRSTMPLSKGESSRSMASKAGLLGAASLALKPILIADTFNRTNDATTVGTSTSGHAWTQVNGPTNVLGISGNQCYPVTTGNCRSTSDVGVTDYLARMTMAVKQEQYLLVRWIDASNYVRIGILSPAGQLTYQRITSGAAVVNASLGITPSAGDDLVVRVVGGQITIWLNDTFVALITENQGLTSTVMGIGMSTNVTGRIDNLLVTSL